MTNSQTLYYGGEIVTMEEGTAPQADLVILERGPLSCPPEEIRNIQVLLTIKVGKTLYEREGKTG